MYARVDVWEGGRGVQAGIIVSPEIMENKHSTQDTHAPQDKCWDCTWWRPQDKCHTNVDMLQ